MLPAAPLQAALADFACRTLPTCPSGSERCFVQWVRPAACRACRLTGQCPCNSLAGMLGCQQGSWLPALACRLLGQLQPALVGLHLIPSLPRLCLRRLNCKLGQGMRGGHSVPDLTAAGSCRSAMHHLCLQGVSSRSRHVQCSCMYVTGAALQEGVALLATRPSAFRPSAAHAAPTCRPGFIHAAHGP